MMRIVYDTEGARPSIPRVPPAGEGRKEQVLVIRVGKEPDEGNGGIKISGRDYEVRISPEAVARDREVRSHEQAHLASLGAAAGGPIIYDTVTGPGGETVAVGGRIAVDLSEVPGDPAATLRKANAIIAAAHAPGEPSAADIRVAAEAERMAQKARQELFEQAMETENSNREDGPRPS